MADDIMPLTTDDRKSMEVRDAQGRFVHGPGRKRGSKNRQSVELMKLARADITVAYLGLRAAVDRQERWAIEWFLKLFFPARIVELDDADIETIKQAFINGEMSADELNTVASGLERLKRVDEQDAIREQLDRIEAQLQQKS